jgi:hypothetical protein
MTNYRQETAIIVFCYLKYTKRYLMKYGFDM